MYPNIVAYSHDTQIVRVILGVILITAASSVHVLTYDQS